MKNLIYFLFILCLPFTLFSQKIKLAQQYYAYGEYEKAAQLYEELLAENYNDHYFKRLIDSKLAIDEYNEAENIVLNEIKKQKNNVSLNVALGNIYDLQLQPEKAAQAYRKAIDKLTTEHYAISKLANSFISITKYKLAAETYIKGADLLKDEYVFSYSLGDVYRRLGNEKLMIENYLISLEKNNNKRFIDRLQTIFQRYLSEDGFTELTEQLYAIIQDKNDNIHYPELLSWVLVQQKNYAAALRQMIALDRRTNGNGKGVYKLSNIALNEGDYNTAIKGFEQIIADKGKQSTYYFESQQKSLYAQRMRITENENYQESELLEVKNKYNSFLDELGRDKRTANISMQQAEFLAYYLDDMESAISILEKIIKYPGMEPKSKVVANAKLLLGDFYLIDGNIWEATLLYSQVDKAFKEGLMGHEARLKNAKLSYYNCDFEWAQSQFDVLKSSTSKLIANDALDLSIFITDNLGLDSTDAAVSHFAKADLMIFQNKHEEAIKKLDSIIIDFPNHSLEDDVFYKKGIIFQEKKKYNLAIEQYQKVIDLYPEGIRADNSLNEMAYIYDYILEDKEKAMALYEKLFIDYDSSTFAFGARKRFRELRGDNDTSKKEVQTDSIPAN